MLFVINACGAQNNTNDIHITMLKEFYTEYCKQWAVKPVPHPSDLYIKLSSLLEKYCTLKLRTEAKEWFDDGHDLLTNDWEIDVESLNTMTIVRDTGKENTYVVSYIVDSFPESPNKPEKKRVSLYVGIVKEGENYRIDSVK